MIKCSLENQITILLVTKVYLSSLLAFWLLTKKTQHPTHNKYPVYPYQKEDKPQPPTPPTHITPKYVTWKKGLPKVLP